MSQAHFNQCLVLRNVNPPRGKWTISSRFRWIACAGGSIGKCFWFERIDEKLVISNCTMQIIFIFNQLLLWFIYKIGRSGRSDCNAFMQCVLRCWPVSTARELCSHDFLLLAVRTTKQSHALKKLVRTCSKAQSRKKIQSITYATCKIKTTRPSAQHSASSWPRTQW